MDSKQVSRLKIDRKYIPLIVTAALLVVMYVSGMIFYEEFRTLRFLVDLLKGNAAVGLCAVGMTFAILSGGIDLSVGSLLAATTTVVAALVSVGADPWLAFLVALLFATTFGMTSGFFIHRFCLPPFLVTLAGLFFARGLAFVVSPQPQSINHPSMDFIMDELGMVLLIPGWEEAYVPPTAIIFIAVLVTGIIVARLTPFGRNVYAVGGDYQAALLMGVPIGATVISVYALSGFCAGLGGVVTTLVDSAGKPNIGVGLELEAIAAVVIGGTMLSRGGVGTVSGTLMGVMIVGLVRAVINLDGRLPSPWHSITIGLLLLAFIAMQQILTRSSSET